MQAVSCLSGDNQGHCCRELTSAVAEEVLGSWYSLVESRVLCVSDRHKHPRMPDDTAECPRGCRGLSSQALAGLASLLSVYPLSFPVFTPLLTGTSHQPPATLLPPARSATIESSKEGGGYPCQEKQVGAQASAASSPSRRPPGSCLLPIEDKIGDGFERSLDSPSSILSFFLFTT